MRVLGEHVNQSSTGLLQTDSDGSATKTLLQICRPSFHCFWGVLQLPLFMLLGAGERQSPEVLLVGPVDGRERGPYRFGSSHRQRFRHFDNSPFERAGLAPPKAL